jgi:hypothetical protein
MRVVVASSHESLKKQVCMLRGGAWVPLFLSGLKAIPRRFYRKKYVI